MPHRKRLSSGHVLYFSHQPPFTELDTVSNSRRLSPPFTRAPSYMCSLYYFWWAFLRENEEYMACCASGGEGPMGDLYRDFGDVRPNDFMGWWIDGGRLLFCEPPEDSVLVLSQIPKTHDDENRVLISVPLDGDVDRIAAEISKALGIKRSERKLSDDRSSKARYQIIGQARLQSLHRQLSIYKARRDSPKLTNIELAYGCGIIPEGATSFNPNSVIAQVSGYHADACKLITNVGKGRFPDYSDPPEEPDLFG